MTSQWYTGGAVH